MGVDLMDQRLLKVQLREVRLDASNVLEVSWFEEALWVFAGIEHGWHWCLALGTGQTALAGPFPIVTVVICTADIESLLSGFTGFAWALACPRAPV